MRTPRLLSRALRVALPLGALAVLAPVAGCDNYGNGDDTYGNVVNVVTFNFNLGDAEATPPLTTLKHFRAEYEAHIREGRCTVTADWRARGALAGAH